ncbi:hypothetical protein IPO96_04070 [Candidatus Saccharibacteria bacterium]|nr:MAG: hypothetical protein IPO96_04070 [Candidatus Saccharibacteria bacterium]
MAIGSAFVAIFLRETAVLSHWRIGSTQLLAASVSLAICSSSDFFSLISSACLVLYVGWSMSWSR